MSVSPTTTTPFKAATKEEVEQAAAHVAEWIQADKTDLPFTFQQQREEFNSEQTQLDRELSAQQAIEQLLNPQTQLSVEQQRQQTLTLISKLRQLEQTNPQPHPQADARAAESPPFEGSTGNSLSVDEKFEAALAALQSLRSRQSHSLSAIEQIRHSLWKIQHLDRQLNNYSQITQHETVLEDTIFDLKGLSKESMSAVEKNHLVQSSAQQHWWMTQIPLIHRKDLYLTQNALTQLALDQDTETEDESAEATEAEAATQTESSKQAAAASTTEE